MDKIKVSIVDDQKLFRQSLAVLINMVDEFQLVAEAESGASLVAKLQAIKGRSDIAIIDLDMPGMSGIELNDILQKHFPDIKIIILSVHMQPRIITQMIGAGVASYLAKNCDKDELIVAIKTAYNAGFYFNQDVLKVIHNSNNAKMLSANSSVELPVKLTEREIQLVTLICKEYSNAEIADKLCLSVRTVEGHRNNLINKIGCRNTAGVVLFAVKYNLHNQFLG